jgi:hypothetical protein
MRTIPKSIACLAETALAAVALTLPDAVRAQAVSGQITYSSGITADYGAPAPPWYSGPCVHSAVQDVGENRVLQAVDHPDGWPEPAQPCGLWRSQVRPVLLPRPTALDGRVLPPIGSEWLDAMRTLESSTSGRGCTATAWASQFPETVWWPSTAVPFGGRVTVDGGCAREAAASAGGSAGVYVPPGTYSYGASIGASFQVGVGGTRHGLAFAEVLTSLWSLRVGLDGVVPFASFVSDPTLGLDVAALNAAPLASLDTSVPGELRFVGFGVSAVLDMPRGFVYDESVSVHAISAVPEPATLAPTAGGLTMFLVAAARRRARA